MPQVRTTIAAFFIIFSTVFFGWHLVFAEPQTPLDRGIIQYQRENYDEALAFFKKAKEEEPTNTRVSYYLGLTYKKLQDYKQSELFLTEAVEGSPKVVEALLELIEVSYQIDDIAAAKKWISVAEEQGMRPGQTAFIKGLVLVKDGKSTEAVDAFSKAKELEPALKQSANYQIGMVHLKDRSYDKAEAMFQEVVLLDPNTDIARYADEYKKVLDRRKEGEKPFRLSASFFEEYDDNVILKPSDSSTVETVGNKGDWRDVLTVNAELGKKFNEGFGAKLQYDLYYANQHELDQFDLHSHTWGLVPSWYFGPHTLSVPVQYNYTWVDGNDFLGTFSTGPQANIKITDNQLAQLGVKVQWKNYFQTPSTPDEDRDAFRWAPGAGWFYVFKENGGFLALRYEYDSENTNGQNWDYDGHHVTASVQVPLPVYKKVKLTLAGDFYEQDFDKTHTVFNIKRQDDAYTLSTMLSYPVSQQIELQLRYTYVQHDSNIAVYDYDRNIFGAGIVGKF